MKMAAKIAAAVCLAAAAGALAFTPGKVVDDLPPGVFSDGGRYTLADFKGKAVVVFFYESACPRCRGLVPERNATVKAYADKPIKFLAVGAHDSMPLVQQYVAGTRLAMPVLPDPFRLAEKRLLAGMDPPISLQNIYQILVFGPDGHLVGYDMTAETLDRALAKAKWKYKDQGYDPKLNAAIERLEFGQYEAGMRLLRPWRSSGDKAVAASAEKLFAAVKEEGQKWKDAAEVAAKDKPVEAYDLYTRLQICFQGDELGKAADEALAKLRKERAVIDELEARKLYVQLDSALVRATPEQKAQVVTFCKTISTKYPTTPTGLKAAALLKELGS